MAMMAMTTSNSIRVKPQAVKLRLPDIGAGSRVVIYGNEAKVNFGGAIVNKV
jgi:hypothetical protein